MVISLRMSLLFRGSPTCFRFSCMFLLEQEPGTSFLYLGMGLPCSIRQVWRQQFGGQTINLWFKQQARCTPLDFSFLDATNFFYLDDVTLTALPATLSIAAQPQSQVIPVGGDTSLAVLVSGASPVTYQWQKNGTNLQDGGDILGSLTGALTITNAALADSGNYAVIVSSNSLSVTSSSCDRNG